MREEKARKEKEGGRGKAYNSLDAKKGIKKNRAIGRSASVR
jgi:hypothetical protein